MNFFQKIPSYTSKQWVVLDYLGGHIGIDIYNSLQQTSKYGTRLSFRWVQLQGCGPDTHGEHKNASDLIGIPLKKEVINLAPPKRVRAWENGLTCEPRQLGLPIDRIKQS